MGGALPDGLLTVAVGYNCERNSLTLIELVLSSVIGARLTAGPPAHVVLMASVANPDPDAIF